MPPIPCNCCPTNVYRCYTVGGDPADPTPSPIGAWFGETTGFPQTAGSPDIFHDWDGAAWTNFPVSQAADGGSAGGTTAGWLSSNQLIWVGVRDQHNVIAFRYDVATQQWHEHCMGRNGTFLNFMIGPSSSPNFGVTAADPRVGPNGHLVSVLHDTPPAPGFAGGLHVIPATPGMVTGPLDNAQGGDPINSNNLRAFDVTNPAYFYAPTGTAIPGNVDSRLLWDNNRNQMLYIDGVTGGVYPVTFNHGAQTYTVGALIQTLPFPPKDASVGTWTFTRQGDEFYHPTNGTPPANVHTLVEYLTGGVRLPDFAANGAAPIPYPGGSPQANTAPLLADFGDFQLDETSIAVAMICGDCEPADCEPTEPLPIQDAVVYSRGTDTWWWSLNNGPYSSVVVDPDVDNNATITHWVDQDHVLRTGNNANTVSAHWINVTTGQWQVFTANRAGVLGMNTGHFGTPIDATRLASERPNGAGGISVWQGAGGTTPPAMTNSTTVLPAFPVDDASASHYTAAGDPYLAGSFIRWDRLNTRVLVIQPDLSVRVITFDHGAQTFLLGAVVFNLPGGSAADWSFTRNGIYLYGQLPTNMVYRLSDGATFTTGPITAPPGPPPTPTQYAVEAFNDCPPATNANCIEWFDASTGDPVDPDDLTDC